MLALGIAGCLALMVGLTVGSLGYAGYEYETDRNGAGNAATIAAECEADAVAERYRVGPTIRRFPQLSLLNERFGLIERFTRESCGSG